MNRWYKVEQWRDGKHTVSHERWNIICLYLLTHRGREDISMTIWF